ncbi:MAG: NACHT domain-containing protein [Chlorobium sp.]|nr:MAG: NACHT domain-containing protein [Chlorobium sp.]
MKLSLFFLMAKVLWLCLFFDAGSVGVVCAQVDSARRVAVVSASVPEMGLAGIAQTPEVKKEDEKPNILTGVIAFISGVWAFFTFVYPRVRSYYKKNKELQRYQAFLREELGYIRLLGLSGVESVKVNLNDDTFVPLRLSDRQETGVTSSEKDTMSGRNDGQVLYPDEIMKRVFNAQSGRRMLLVIGDPGAGKTTLLKYYALSALDRKRSLRLGFSGLVNVFYLPLRDLVRDEKGHYDSLPVNLAFWSEKHHHTLAAQYFDDWLQSGTALVLLDGLDEISNVADRIQVCKWIDNAWSGLSNVFFVVTSRATGYNRDEGIELAADYERANVQDFTSEQQERFLTNWFSAAFLKDPRDEGMDKIEWQRCQKAKAHERTRKIVALLKEEKNKGLRQLAAVPMILQIMAILWKDRDYLPESRVDLYNAVLDYFLELRDKRREITVLIPAKRARMVLGPVSLWMQEEMKTDEVEREKMQAKMQERLDILCEKNYTPPSVDDFCTYLVNRAGLLVEYGSTAYIFRHKSFREYLAGVELVRTVLQNPEYLDTLISGFGVDWWEEPLKFFVAQVDEKTFDLFIEKFFNSTVSATLTPKQQLLLHTLIEEAPQKKIDALCKKLLLPATDASRQRVILDCLKIIGKLSALETLQQFKADGLAKNTDVADRAEEVILALGDMKLVSESQKSETGEKEIQFTTVIARFVQLKYRQPSFRNPNEHYAEYIRIPGGSFRYSVSGKKERAGDLYFAKYPVTNKFYRSFIAYVQSQAPDYEARLPLSTFRNAITDIEKRNLWDDGFAAYLNEGKDDLASLFRSKRDEDRKFDGDDQPVVSITWYAAKAYCLWLSLLEGGEDGLYRLPTEQEWEFAAAGKEGREYPWPEERGEPSAQLANYNEHVGATTPVGSYPDGATPEGLYDMAGNVWEWMDYKYNKDTSARAVRGGSWFNDPVSLRCSARLNDVPAVRNDAIGFRVVRPSPSS